MTNPVASAGNSYPVQSVTKRNVANTAVPAAFAEKVTLQKPPAGLRASAPLFVMSPEILDSFMDAMKTAQADKNADWVDLATYKPKGGVTP